MALECGALAVGHPNSDRLVSAWLAVSSRLGEAKHLLHSLKQRHHRQRWRWFALVRRLVRLLEDLYGGGGDDDDSS
uniref:Uncharacterized protein n=1 Tax=Oryza punctata TaxID=4537 RepID=A0A0E0M8G0_ORYPU